MSNLKDNDKKRIAQQQRRANMTDEEKLKEKERNKVSHMKSRFKMTPEQKANEREKDRLRHLESRHKNLSPNKKEINKTKQKDKLLKRKVERNIDETATVTEKLLENSNTDNRYISAIVHYSFKSLLIMLYCTSEFLCRLQRSISL